MPQQSLQQMKTNSPRPDGGHKEEMVALQKNLLECRKYQRQWRECDRRASGHLWDRAFCRSGTSPSIQENHWQWVDAREANLVHLRPAKHSVQPHLKGAECK